MVPETTWLFGLCEPSDKQEHGLKWLFVPVPPNYAINDRVSFDSVLNPANSSIAFPPIAAS
jgi:hypothetical protein